LKDWFNRLPAACCLLPPALSRFLPPFILLLLCLVTRIIAIPASLWEWDEILFAHSLHVFNVPAHSPHPPGFPIFVALGRIGYALLGDEQKALAWVNVFFSTLLGPALFYFYREVFADRIIAFAGALLGSFAANIWVYSGASRSDGPALTLGLIGLTLVIRGLRSRRALLLGCALFGVGLGVRVTLMPLIAPALVIVLWSRRREWRLVLAALLIAAAGVLCWYIPVIWHHTFRAYHDALRQHQEYVLTYDSIFGGTPNARPGYRLRWFFIRLWAVDWIMWSIYVLSALGMVALALKQRWRTLGWLAVAFLPFMIFTILINLPMQAIFHAMPYTPLFTGLVGAGLVLGTQWIWRSKRPRLPEMAGLALASALALAIAAWCYPIVRLMRGEPSPPLRALEYMKEKIDPQGSVLYHDKIYDPHVEFYLPQHRKVSWYTTSTSVNDGAQSVNRLSALPFTPHSLGSTSVLTEVNLIAPLDVGRRLYGLTADPILGYPTHRFHWTPGIGERRLRRLSLERYFDLYVTDLTGERGIVFLSGWHRLVEYGEDTAKPWMDREAHIALFNSARRMKLHLRAETKISSAGVTLSQPGSTIVLKLDGHEIARLLADGDQIDYTGEAQIDPQRLWSKLTLETDRTLNLSLLGRNRDQRKFGLQCSKLQWSPAPGAPRLINSQDHFLGPGWLPLDNEIPHSRLSAGRATIHLPAIEGDARLITLMGIPEPGDLSNVRVIIALGGEVIDQYRPPVGRYIKFYTIPAKLHKGGPVDLELSASFSGSNSDLKRPVIQVNHISWRPGD
jgi:Dolichyl-phosphate-mannose-protein mannosyltransferase